MADTPKHSVSVAGIVVDEQDRVLVIQRRDNGHWEPPGGVLENEETPEQGVKREVFEETGIHVRVCKLSGVYKNMTAGVVSLVYKCVPVSGYRRPSAESHAVEWLDLQQVRSRMNPAYSVRVEDALTDDVHSRSHDGVSLLTREGDRV